jgi:hypothetical protein
MVKRPFIFALTFLVTAVPSRGSADLAPVPVSNAEIRVTAQRVAYYADASTVRASGDVVVTMPDGVIVEGDEFSMDLALKRLLVAGHVSLHTPSGDFVGAAFAEFLAFRRGYFVPLEPAADRWTFLDGDYADPHKGRVMPGDAFSFPDLSGARPFVIGRSARIDPNDYAAFVPATILLLDTVDSVPLPAYVENYSDNPDFGVNSLSGATFDAPYAFAGSSNSLDTLHLRYDQSARVRGFASVELHRLFDGGYVVASLNPATQPTKQWNLVGYAATGARSAVAVTAQLFTTQFGLASPSSSSGFVDASWTRALRQSSVRVEVTQSYDTFVNSGPPDRPVQYGVAWAGFDEPIGASGFTYRLQSGLAVDHDAFGISGLPQANADMQYVGATVATPMFSGPLQTDIDATFQEQHEWISLRNQMDVQTSQLAAARRLSPRLFATLSAVIGGVRVDDPARVVISPSGISGFAPTPASPNGLPFLGAVTTGDRTTSRGYGLTLSWQPSIDFQLSAIVQKTSYSPVQEPFVAGPPQYQLSSTARFRVTRTLYLTIGRSYFFDWAGQAWSPQFSFQVSPR